ncbi:MAG: chemotaxis protein CheA [candidate division Zixibacteria bacterium]
MSNSVIDNEQSEFIQAFVEEGREMLDEVEPLLIELEQISDQSSEVDPEVINTIFRLFHSLKGAAGFLDFDTVSKVTHEAETLLDLFRKGTGRLESAHIDTLTKTADFIRNLLDQIENEYHDKGVENEAEVLIGELSAMIDKINGGDSGGKKKKTSKSSSKKAAKKAVDNENKETKQPSVKSPSSEPQMIITPEMTKQFVSESEELLETAEQALLELEKKPENDEFVSRAFRALHSFKGNSGFFGFVDLENVSHQAETVLDKIKESSEPVEGKIFSILLEVLDFLRLGVLSLNEGRDPEIPGKAGVISFMEEAIDTIDDSSDNDSVDIGEDTVQSEEQVDKSQVPEVDSRNETRNTPERRKEEDRRAVGDRRVSDRRSSEKSAQRQTIRVDIEKLDILLDLIGELVISEAMVAQNPDLKDLDHSLDRFEKSVLQLNKITRDLQDVATSVRMIPLSGTFRKMIRLVRDLGHKSGKKVELELIGEETEVDKTVIEKINDPLVHIIRNSLDHGMETTEERIKQNKSDVGKVTLEARYVGGEVWIIINDDGKGLNRDKLISKAIDRGIISGDGSEMRDDDVWQLIFHPGFSTADKITDISGRGVGMDVVKRNIEKIRGKVDVKSKAGQGTTVILRIPLTLAIIDGMIVKIGNTFYVIPIVAIKESFKIESNQITKMMDGQEIVNLRNQLIPVVRLHELLDLNEGSQELRKGIIVIVENEGETACLFVDEVVGQQQIVIKGLPEYVGNMNNVSGCTILGDGTISLILDVKGIISIAADNESLENIEDQAEVEKIA